jgi:Na+-translocating ferredoxin:NAD+ oxidoreductase RnfD subunit
VIRRFFRTPKGLLIIVLSLVTALAVTNQNLRLVGTALGSAIGVAAGLDLLVLRYREGHWTFPSGAILTGWLIAMVVSPYERWYVAPITAALGVATKYVFRSGSANVFNPAAFAIVITFYALGTGQDWWGALPDLSVMGLAGLLAGGIYITNRVNKMPMVLVFLGAYFVLFTATAFVSDPKPVAEIFRQPDASMALFFAFFILTDPPTSPVKYRDQMICGAIVAVSSFAIFQLVGAVHYLLSGVLAGNVWEAWRRQRLRANRAVIG